MLSNPPANALSRAAIDELRAALDAARNDPAVRVIVIAATGKVFSAGHDLKEMTAHRSDADRGRAFFEETMAACSALMQAIVTHPKPVIAEVDGLATAAGLQLVASCDLAIASDRATFCTPGVNIGLFCSTPMVALSRNVSRKQAMEMLLTGETIDAATARDFGLVNRVVPPRVSHADRHQIRADHCLQIAFDAEDRQGGILPAGRDEPRGRLSPRLGGDGREHAGARRRRGHRRLPRQARSRMDGGIAMEPRVSIITLGVADLDRAVAFYEAMGLVRNQAVTDGVAFFQMGGTILGLWPRAELARGCGRRRRRRWIWRRSAYNTRSDAEVDAVLAAAAESRRPHRQAGAEGLLGRLVRLFRRRGRPSLGGRAQPGIPDRRRRQHFAAAHEPRPL